MAEGDFAYGVKITGKGEFSSDDHYIYYCWQESLRRNGVAIMVKKKKSKKCSIWMQSQKLKNDFSSFPRQTIRYHSNPSPRPVMLKKLKLNGSMKSYKTS